MKPERYVVLSEVRTKVLRQAVAGRTPTEIAADLGISRKRVYDHLTALKNAGFLPNEGVLR